MQLDRDKILAFVTIHGSAYSHTAILARTMNIPSIVCTNIELDPNLDGLTAIVNGNDGTVYIDPDLDYLDENTTILHAEMDKREQLQSLKGKKNVTLDGREVIVNANICNIKDVANVIKNDAGGIGLFRSEFLFLEKDSFPTEEEQFQVYKAVAQKMGKDKYFAIRTLDIGADKQAGYFNLPHEDNPALGLRAVRFCLRYPEIFRTQLRAIFRASIYGKLGIIYPMITTENEVHRIKKIVESVKQELIDEGYQLDPVEFGIMIETPSAVMISDRLAKEADFFSIGTNDLAQYTMAADRQHPDLKEYFDPYHTAVLKMIKIAVDNAKKNGIRVGICGELAVLITQLLIAIGVDELSVAPSSVLPVRKTIIETDVSIIREKMLSMF